LNTCSQEQEQPPAQRVQENALQQLNYITLQIFHLIPEDSNGKKYNLTTCIESET
jgi:hypothetical protein